MTMQPRHAFIPLGVGLALAILALGIAWLLSDTQALEFHAVLLAVIGMAYLAFAFQDGRLAHIFIEVPVAILFILAALAGLWTSAWFTVLGLALHGGWDFLHHRVIHTKIPRWWIPLCMVFDIVVALGLTVILLLS